MTYYLEKPVPILKRGASPRAGKRLNRKHRVATGQALSLVPAIRMVTSYLKGSVLDAGSKSSRWS